MLKTDGVYAAEIPKKQGAMSSLSWLIPLAPLLQNHDRDQPVGLIPIFLASVIGWHERYGVGKLVDRHRLDAAKKLDFKLSRNIPKRPEFGQSGSRKSRSPYKGTGFGQKTGSGRTTSDGVAGKLGGDRSGARGG